MKTVPHLFADITAKLEDTHAISIDGHSRSNSPDMQRALSCHLRMAIVAMGGIVDEINQRLSNAHD